MKFIEMTGKTLKELISDDELHVDDLIQCRGLRRHDRARQPARGHRSPAARELGRDRRSARQLRATDEEANGARLGGSIGAALRVDSTYHADFRLELGLLERLGKSTANRPDRRRAWRRRLEGSRRFINSLADIHVGEPRSVVAPAFVKLDDGRPGLGNSLKFVGCISLGSRLRGGILLPIVARGR